MKKVIRFIIISLAPIVTFIAYSNLYDLARTYVGTHYDILPIWITMIAGFGLIGTAIFFICKGTLKQTNNLGFPVEFLIGILLVIFPFVNIFIGINIPIFFFINTSIELTLIGLVTGVYICLFMVLMRRRSTALKQKKESQSVQPHV